MKFITVHGHRVKTNGEEERKGLLYQTAAKIDAFMIII